MSKRIIPLLDRILVERVKAAQRTASGLYIPEKSQETLNEGIVISVGPGAHKDGKLIPVTVAEGDKVLLPPYGGNAVKVGEREFLIFRDSEILAKVQE